MTARLVVLDLGSTLVAGSPGHPATRIAEQLGMSRRQRLELNDALMTRPFVSPSEAAVVARAILGAEAEAVDVDSVLAEIWSAQEQEAEAIEGALETLSAICDSGLQLAIVSNIWQPYLRSIERHYGSFFAQHVPPELQLFSYRQGQMKPAPELFRRVLDKAGVPAEDAVMVGDSYDTDIAPALALGMKAVWVLQRPEREVASLVRVLNGAAASPSAAISSILELDIELLERVWGPRTGSSPASADSERMER